MKLRKNILIISSFIVYSLCLPAGQAGLTTGSAFAAERFFEIKAKKFSYTPNIIHVNKGDTVKITFVNSNGFHNLKIDEFNASTKTISTGQQETITFLADKSGTFEYYCSVGNHRAMGMFGKLKVI